MSQVINNQAQNIPPINPALQEEIVVVPCKALFATIKPWNGFLAHDSVGNLFEIICENYTFYTRYLAEEDPTFKQIIPYMVFMHKDRLFLMQRQKKCNEKRLAGKFSLGIGGHLNEKDITCKDPFAWGVREFIEEVEYNDAYTVKLLGFVNDEETPVGRVHLGVCMLIVAATDNITVKEELLQGNMKSFDEIDAQYDTLETWSRYVFDYIKSTKESL